MQEPNHKLIIYKFDRSSRNNLNENDLTPPDYPEGPWKDWKLHSFQVSDKLTSCDIFAIWVKYLR